MVPAILPPKTYTTSPITSLIVNWNFLLRLNDVQNVVLQMFFHFDITRENLASTKGLN
jgi:hypothetical protein